MYTNYRRKPSSKRQSRYKKKYNKSKAYKSLDRKISKLQNDIELKQVRYSVNAQNIVGATTPSGLSPSTLGYFLELSDFTRGTLANNYVGAEVRVTSVNFRLIFLQDRSAVANWLNDGWNMIRVMVVKLRTPNTPGSFPAMNFILRSGGVSNAINTALLTYNYPNRKQYKILYDKTIDISDPAYFEDGAGSDFSWNPGKSIRMMKKKIRLSTKVTFDAAGDAIGNTLWFIAYSTSTVTPHPIMHGEFAVNYQDA